MSAKINFEIIGNKELTDVYNMEDITVSGKVERNLNDVVTGDGWISTDNTQVTDIDVTVIGV